MTTTSFFVSRLIIPESKTIKQHSQELEEHHQPTLTTIRSAIMSAISRPITSRLWNHYTTALRERPLRTKMIQSGVLFITADIVAQLGIEGRSLRRAISGEEGDEVYEVGQDDNIFGSGH